MRTLEELKEINVKRKQLLEYINNHPEKNLIHVDKEELEELIFDTNYALGFDSNYWGKDFFNLPGFGTEQQIRDYYPDLNAVKRKAMLAKFPVWTGEFLRRIDLSEIDWSNVVWDPEVMTELDIIWLNSMSDYHYATPPIEIPHGLDNDTASEECVDLSFTNAVIDLSQSFSAKALKENNSIYQCNFRGVRLVNTECVTAAMNCDLQGTDFKVNKKGFYAHSSDLRTIDLTGIKTTYMAGCMGSERYSCFFDNCILTNTGLYVYSEIQPKGNNHYFDSFVNNIEKGYYDGCMINIGYLCDEDEDDYDDDFGDDFGNGGYSLKY